MFASTRKNKPPRIVLYGDHGVGKTTFAASAPSCALLNVEQGADNVDVQGVDIKSHQNAIDAIKWLSTEKHDFKTIAIDSLDWLEPLVWQAVCKEHSKDSIEDFGFGKGYVYAEDYWRKIFSGLDYLRDNRGMAAILLAHQQIKRFDDPMADPYDRVDIKLHKNAAALCEEWADAIFFATQEVNIKSTDVGFNKKVSRAIGGRRIMHTSGAPGYRAKNRYSLPETLPLSWDAFLEAIKQSKQKLGDDQNG